MYPFYLSFLVSIIYGNMYTFQHFIIKGKPGEPGKPGKDLRVSKSIIKSQSYRLQIVQLNQLI